MKAVVLDSEAISQLARTRARNQDDIVHAAISAATITDAPVVVPAAVLAELYRGNAHDQILDSCLARYPGIQVMDTTRNLARSIGNILGRAKLGSAHHVDATVIATALTFSGSVILTSDPDDLNRLAAGRPDIAIIAL